MKLIGLIVLMFAITACVTDSQKQNSTNNSPVVKKVNDSELAQRLYLNFHDDPITQAQKDENALIDYALDKNIDVQRSNSGLYYHIKEKGNGPLLKMNQPCKAHYQGYFLDGKIFDASYKRGEPIVFNVGQMIPGWNEALLMMNSGSKAQLLIPSRLAYGEKGFPGFVPPNTPLVFDIEVLPMLSKG